MLGEGQGQENLSLASWKRGLVRGCGMRSGIVGGRGSAGHWDWDCYEYCFD